MGCEHEAIEKYSTKRQKKMGESKVNLFRNYKAGNSLTQNYKCSLGPSKQHG